MNGFLCKALLVSLLIVCGCSGRRHEWRMVGVSPDQADRDCRQCSKEANVAVNVSNYDAYRDAKMAEKPYVPPLDRSDSDYVESCMRAKGYRRVLVDF